MFDYVLISDASCSVAKLVNVTDKLGAFVKMGNRKVENKE